MDGRRLGPVCCIICTGRRCSTLVYLDCDNPVRFWSWGTEVVSVQNGGGVVADRLCEVGSCNKAMVCIVPCWRGGGHGIPGVAWTMQLA